MPLVAPISQVRLMSVPFEIDYNHVIDFRASAGSGHPAAQTNYFLSLPSLQVYDFMYIRQNSGIKVPFPKDQVMHYNYCMYKNNQFSDKWFYAFITDVQYINPNTAELFLSTDVFQTYYFDLSFKTSFIEREHQNRWTTSGSPIFNPVPENLECGNIVRTLKTITAENQETATYLVFSNHPLASGDTPNINVTPFSPINFIYTYLLKADGLLTFISEYAKTDSEFSSYIVSITPYLGAEAWVAGSVNQYGLHPINIVTRAKKSLFNFSHSPSDFNFEFPPVGTSAGWAHEPKLLTYPYSFYELSISNGDSSIYQFEYLSNSGTVYAVSSVTPFQKTVYFLSGQYLGVNENPQNFVVNNSNYDVGLISSAWSNYMASNKASFTIGTFNSLAQGMIGNFTAAAMGNPFGVISNTTNILTSISSAAAKLQDLRSSPSSYSNGASDFYIDLVNNNLQPKLYYKQIDTQFLQILGDYFMKFGYKCNRVKVPDTLSRHRFNFLKTINCEFTGDIPQDDLSALKSIFDKGVTLWHDPSYFLDYSIDNTEQNRY